MLLYPLNPGERCHRSYFTKQGRGTMIWSPVLLFFFLRFPNPILRPVFSLQQSRQVAHVTGCPVSCRAYKLSVIGQRIFCVTLTLTLMLTPNCQISGEPCRTQKATYPPPPSNECEDPIRPCEATSDVTQYTDKQSHLNVRSIILAYREASGLHRHICVCILFVISQKTNVLEKLHDKN